MGAAHDQPTPKPHPWVLHDLRTEAAGWVRVLAARWVRAGCRGAARGAAALRMPPCASGAAARARGTGSLAPRNGATSPHPAASQSSSPPTRRWWHGDVADSRRPAPRRCPAPSAVMPRGPVTMPSDPTVMPSDPITMPSDPTAMPSPPSPLGAAPRGASPPRARPRDRALLTPGSSGRQRAGCGRCGVFGALAKAERKQLQGLPLKGKHTPLPTPCSRPGAGVGAPSPPPALQPQPEPCALPRAVPSPRTRLVMGRHRPGLSGGAEGNGVPRRGC